MTEQKWYELRVLLKDHGIESRYYRYYSKRKKEYCSGLALCIRDVNIVPVINTVISVMQFFKREGIKVSLSDRFDVAVGSKHVREFLEGKISRDQLELHMNNQVRSFFHKAASSFIYTPLPKVVSV